MKALQSVKGKVDKELSLARSLLLDLEANETEAFLPIQEEIATILKAVDSWLLFCRKALNQGNKANPDTKLEELKELASQLFELCLSQVKIFCVTTKEKERERERVRERETGRDTRICMRSSLLDVMLSC